MKIYYVLYYRVMIFYLAGIIRGTIDAVIKGKTNKEDKKMKKSDQIIIKLEFDRSVRYLDSRKDELTTNECMQEIGALRLFIYNMGFENN